MGLRLPKAEISHGRSRVGNAEIAGDSILPDASNGSGADNGRDVHAEASTSGDIIARASVDTRSRPAGGARRFAASQFSDAARDLAPGKTRLVIAHAFNQRKLSGFRASPFTGKT